VSKLSFVREEGNVTLYVQ